MLVPRDDVVSPRRPGERHDEIVAGVACKSDDGYRVRAQFGLRTQQPDEGPSKWRFNAPPKARAVEDVPELV